MFRPSSAVVIVATVLLEMLFAGVPKFGWLSRLNTSHRNSAARRPPAENRLVTARSTRWVPGPMTVLRPAVPCVPAAVATYAVGSNHIVGVGLLSLPLSFSRPGAKFTRWGTYEPHWHTLADVIENGNPLANRITP